MSYSAASRRFGIAWSAFPVPMATASAGLGATCTGTCSSVLSHCSMPCSKAPPNMGRSLADHLFCLLADCHELVRLAVIGDRCWFVKQKPFRLAEQPDIHRP